MTREDQVPDPLAGYTPDWRERHGAPPRGVFRPRPMQGQFLPVAGKILQGASFGFSDEIVGALRGMVDPNVSIPEGIAAERAELARTTSEHPVISGASEFGGALMSGGGALGAAGKTALARAIPRVAQPFIAGAAAGGLAAAGTSEGGPVDRLKGAVPGAFLGAAVSAAGAGLGAGASKARRALGGAGKVRAAGRSITTPAGMSRTVAPAEARAAGIMRTNLKRANVGVDDLEEAARRFGNGTGKPVNIMDAAGSPMQKLGRASESIPSRGAAEIRGSLEGRNAAQRTRVLGDIEELSGLPREDIFARADEIVARRAEAAKPLYKAAHYADDAATQLRTVGRDVVGDALNDPAFRRAYREAERIARREGESLPPLFIEDSKGGYTLVSDPAVKALDYMKQGLDDLIEKRMRGGRMSRREARLLRKQLGSVLDRVDEAVPEYAEARAAWSGGSREKEALEQGQKAVRKDPRLIRREIAKLPESARPIYRASLLDEIRRTKVDRSASRLDVSRLLTDKADDVERLRATFDNPQKFSEFMRRARTEREMFETSTNVLGGSPTARIQQEVADLRGADLSPVVEAAMNPMRLPSLLAREGLRGELARRAAGLTEETVDELAPRLTGPLQETVDWLRQIGEVERAAAIEEAFRRSGRAGAVVGNLAGR